MNNADIEQLKKMAHLPTSSFLGPFINDEGQIDWIALVADRNAKIKELEKDLKTTLSINETLNRQVAALTRDNEELREYYGKWKRLTGNL